MNLDDRAVYPGHPVTVALSIVTAFPSWLHATANNAALSSSLVPGAGGNVHLAMDLLLDLGTGGDFNDVFARADAVWAACDDIKAQRPEVWAQGQEQADGVKKALLEALSFWSFDTAAPFVGYVESAKLPVKKGQTITIRKGVTVKTIGKPAKLAGKTYQVTVDHVLPGSSNMQHRQRTEPPYHFYKEVTHTSNPKAVWAGPGGYWTEVDLNDVPEALPAPADVAKAG